MAGYLVRVSGHRNAGPIGQVTAAERVQVSDKAFVEDLKTYLKAAECSVRVVSEVTLDVSMPRAPSADQALREIAIYLRTWQAMNPDAHAHIVGEGETG